MYFHWWKFTYVIILSKWKQELTDISNHSSEKLVSPIFVTEINKVFRILKFALDSEVFLQNMLHLQFYWNCIPYCITMVRVVQVSKWKFKVQVWKWISTNMLCLKWPDYWYFVCRQTLSGKVFHTNISVLKSWFTIFLVHFCNRQGQKYVSLKNCNTYAIHLHYHTTIQYATQHFESLMKVTYL